MNSTTSRPKKSRSSKARKPKRTAPRAPSSPRSRKSAVEDKDSPAAIRAAFRKWRAALPTQLERETLLWPEVVADRVVHEVRVYLHAEVPAEFPARLAAKAYFLYDHNRLFRARLRLPGNAGRDTLYSLMRHWTASWLKRECRDLFDRLPEQFCIGIPIRR